LVSSIIGGLLVLAGQFLTRRAEDRRQWLVRLHESAGDLASSYLHEAALVNDSQRARKDKNELSSAAYVVDRQKALGRFRTLPWSSNFEIEQKAMGVSIQKVWSAWDMSDPEFQRAYNLARDDVAHFTSAVGDVPHEDEGRTAHIGPRKRSPTNSLAPTVTHALARLASPGTIPV
jgi:hypothetical protein